MNMFEFAIARTYFQLLATVDKRPLNLNETQLLQNLTPSIHYYEARETRQLTVSGATS